ncbi:MULTISPECIES: glutamine-hydrolyzing carbamoyl-phosphate synthase small subunit [unclassified Micromonospora]|uniref:glutamine-hydrolyzing carbamoyl-phosphate synthase small subunit n=1 Tax=unclassified Micromonospora TaxID=2617518 RepID=UPI001C2178DC|nr:MULTISPECIES: glutamine-hydrolyzing carbamoyl-phosphate synthase small subunit [unclassified Micromonospora]MBU8860118.1 glutamine-hydrolyzing carbamoyl-phosphate synthase small subunit [Micromonospora sp. WMMB482]MDM4779649.1 glutamine-hydrolyzing carbamoyl-phosphate synthase small subunit [Micromonospora sp. b486]
MKRRSAILVLEDGRTFHGEAYGSVGETFGEAVFNTGMTGYQETLTDPSYHRQVVVQTAPHIGNTGVNGSDDESDRIWVAGYVVRDPARISSNWRATGGLEDRLAAEGVVGISGVDTRALTRHLRERGAMRVGISSVDDDPAALLERVRRSPQMVGANLSDEVTTAEPYVVQAQGEHRFTVAAVDLGIKRNVPRRLAARGVTTHVLPAGSTIEDLLATGADAVFFSPGPGDPATADGPVALAREVLTRRIPLFGICFGSQILGRALGFGTYKLGYGHRGINQPVLDRATGKVEVTSHNHGFAVQVPGAGDGAVVPDQVIQTEFGGVQVSHVCLNDNVVEGLRAVDVPAFTVQYHPEAAAGPHDADYLFDRFAELIEGGGLDRKQTGGRDNA